MLLYASQSPTSKTIKELLPNIMLTKETKKVKLTLTPNNFAKCYLVPLLSIIRGPLVRIFSMAELTLVYLGTSKANVMFLGVSTHKPHMYWYMCILAKSPSLYQ